MAGQVAPTLHEHRPHLGRRVPRAARPCGWWSSVVCSAWQRHPKALEALFGQGRQAHGPKPYTIPLCTQPLLYTTPVHTAGMGHRVLASLKQVVTIRA